MAATLLLLLVVLCCANNNDKAKEKVEEDPDITALKEWRAGETVSAEAVKDFQLDNCFAAEPIPDRIWQRMQGKSYKKNPYIGREDLRHVKVLHWDYDQRIHIGEMVCNKTIAHDLLCIFKTLFMEAYPINSIRLVDDFDASDEASMQANNSSCFNYRTIAGSHKLSRHAFGMAVDINPLQNPCVRGTRIRPSTATDYVDRSKDFPHKIDDNDLCKKTFESHGFRWGGRWRSMKDYQHFEKR